MLSGYEVSVVNKQMFMMNIIKKLKIGITVISINDFPLLS